MRLDTADDVNAAVARYLELIKLAALIQRPGAEPAPRGARGDQRAARPRRLAGAADGARGLGARRYVLGEERERDARREQVAARREPSLEQFLPRRKGRARPLGLGHRPLPDLPAQVQVRPRLRDPAGADDQPALRDPHPQRPRALPRRGDARRRRRATTRRSRPRPAGWTGCSACSRRAGAGRASAPPTTSSSTATARSPRSPATTSATHGQSPSPVWLERNFAFTIGPHQLRGRVDRVDRLPDGGYELIDYKTGDPGSGPKLSRRRAARRSTGSAAREAWRDRGRERQLLVRARRRARPDRAEPDDAERVERTVLEVAAGITEQDFEPRPSHEICSWCDYRLICPASRRRPERRLALTVLAESVVVGHSRAGAPSRRPRRRRAGAGSAGSRGRSCRRTGPRPRSNVGSSACSTRAGGRAPRSRGWRRRRGRPGSRSAPIASSSSEASIAIPVKPSSRRSSASAAFGFGTAAT